MIDTLPTALVIDDDPDFRSFARQALTRLGFRVTEAGDAWAALRILAANPRPRLVCLDLMLPGVSGYELCEKIRSDPSLRGVPVLAVSARTHPQDVALARTVGADVVLGKPVRLGTLGSAALKLLRGDGAAEEAR